jgi:hypothetical protein
VTAPLDPTAHPAHPDGPKRPSSAGYWIAAAIFVVGCFSAVLWFGIAVFSALDATDDYGRMAVPGIESFQLDEGDWVIYHEYRGAGTTRLPEPDVVVEDPSGRQVQLYYPGVSIDYDFGGNEGVAIAEFEAFEAGTYTIEAFAEPQGLAGRSNLAVGRPFAPSLWQVLASVGLGLLSVVVAFLLVIITLVRQARAKRARAAAAGPPSFPGVPPSAGGPPVPSAPSVAPPPTSSAPPPAPAAPPPPPAGAPPPPSPSPWDRPAAPPGSWPRSWPDQPPEGPPGQG